jgi:hypothetical protein
MMKTKAMLIMLMMAPLFFGCTVLSFYPLYTEDTLIRDDRITGKWYTTDGNLFDSTPADTIIWDISFPENIQANMTHAFANGVDETIPNSYAYNLNMYNQHEPETGAEFILHLVKLGDQVFVDFFPIDYEESFDNTLLVIHLMGVHTFAKIDYGEQLTINWFDAELMQTLFNENRIRVKHENNGVYTLLTAKPVELQKFVQKYAGEKSAFSEDLLFKLSKY